MCILLLPTGLPPRRRRDSEPGDLLAARFRPRNAEGWAALGSVNWRSPPMCGCCALVLYGVQQHACIRGELLPRAHVCVWLHSTEAKRCCNCMQSCHFKYMRPGNNSTRWMAGTQAGRTIITCNATAARPNGALNASRQHRNRRRALRVQRRLACSFRPPKQRCGVARRPGAAATNAAMLAPAPARARVQACLLAAPCAEKAGEGVGACTRRTRWTGRAGGRDLAAISQSPKAPAGGSFEIEPFRSSCFQCTPPD